MGVADGAVIGITKLFGTAPSSRAFNIAMLAEGFTEVQQSAFDSACDSFLGSFLRTPPYDVFKDVINVFRINVSSIESGASDPVAAGGTGKVVRTYFDASFGALGVRRLLVCNDLTATTVAVSQLPEVKAILVVVNSPIYGGSGGSVGTYSLAQGASEIALHELGHTVFLLADEYSYYGDENEAGHSHHPTNEPHEPNVTISSDRATLKWAWAVNPQTPIPTQANHDCEKVSHDANSAPIGTVGLFEGAHYYHCGVYRSEFNCKMRSLGVPYCRICRETIASHLKLFTKD